HKMAPVLAVNDHAGEGKHQERGNGLQHEQSAQRHLRMRGLQDVPGHAGGVHPAADHGDDVCDKHQTKSTMAQDGPHNSLYHPTTHKVLSPRQEQINNSPPVGSPAIRGLSKFGLAAAALALTTGPARPAIKPFLVYHDGTDIIFAPEVTGTQRPARL